ncbi:anaerobic sulfatase maturase [Bifidobacterium sp. UTCIF-39]|uniref:anaerobic sulfatase maturase n=1 Tax=Bifidobacterium sp. UTCIF-39 TaxID=1465359 RepID=UPI00112E495E|nr:anaerobic sulfatase maturase [Bifidobacterium sp. UTCIF-39]
MTTATLASISNSEVQAATEELTTNQTSATLQRTPLTRRRLPFSVVAKPTGAACNLDCQYCFFLSKELLYNAQRQQMSEATLERYVAEYLAASPDGEVTMLWQGGEPTLRGLPFYRRLIELCEQYRRPNQHVVHAMQTNGTLIDEEWAEFLHKHDVLVGVSIDGPAECHDAYRLNRAGRGTHSMVIRGWRRLQDAGVRCNILCTVHHANERHPLEVYRYFRDELGADYLQFIPIVERVDPEQLNRVEHGGWRATGTRRNTNNSGQGGSCHQVGLLYRQHGDAVTSRSVKPEAYGDFLNTIFDEWITHDVGRVFVQDFDAALGALFGQYSVCVHAPECGTNMALEFNGDVYACDHWVEPDWLVGNINDSDFASLAGTPLMQQFSLKKHAQLPDRCCTCPFLRMCNGGCPKDRFVSPDAMAGNDTVAAKTAETTNGASQNLQNYLCPGFAKFYGHIRPDMIGMARLLRAGRAPYEIMNPDVRAKVRAKTTR